MPAPAADGARVIVSFKADAPLLREQRCGAASRRPRRRPALRSARGRARPRAPGLPLDGGRGRGRPRPGGAGRRASTRHTLAAPPGGGRRGRIRRWSTSAPRAGACPTTRCSASGAGQRAAARVGQWYLRAPAGDGALGDRRRGRPGTRTTGSAGVVVAVLDTGVRFDHPDLAGPAAARLRLGQPTRPIANDGDGRDGDPSDPGDWVTAAESSAAATFPGLRRRRPAPGTAPRSPASSARPPTTAIGMAGTGPACACCRCACSASAAATTPTSQPACAGPPGSRCRACRSTRTPARGHQPEPGRQRRLQRAPTRRCDRRRHRRRRGGRGRRRQQRGPGGRRAGQLPRRDRASPGCATSAPRSASPTSGPRSRIAAPGGNCVNIGDGEPCLYPILTTTNSGTQRPTPAARSTPTASTSASAPASRRRWSPAPRR